MSTVEQKNQQTTFTSLEMAIQDDDNNPKQFISKDQGLKPQKENVIKHSQSPTVMRLSAMQTSATLSPLKPLTTYEVTVKAVNQLGIGPSSNPLVMTTIEEAPSSPPTNIQLIPISSTSLQIVWQQPPTIVENADVDTPSNNSRSAESSIFSSPGNIDDNQDYSLKHSNLHSSASFRGSKIKGYYLGYKIHNSSDPYIYKTINNEDSNSSKYKSNENIDTFANSNLANGREDESKVVMLQSKASQQNNLASILITDLKRLTKYSIIIQAFNSAGLGPQSDVVESQTLENDPPPLATLRVGSATFSSIEFIWTFDELNQIFINEHTGSLSSQVAVNSSGDVRLIVDGYNFYHKSSSDNEWTKNKLVGELYSIKIDSRDRLRTMRDHMRSFRYDLTNLKCGTLYQAYLVPYNNIGKGSPSQIVKTRTKGSGKDFMTFWHLFFFYYIREYYLHL